AGRVSAGVVEVEMGVEHPAYVLRPKPELGERVCATRAAVPPFVFDAVNVLELGRFLVADSGVDQDRTVAVLDQQAAQRERDPVALVRGDAPLPQRLGHDAEHGAAVQTLQAAFERMAGQAPDAERGMGHHSNAECGVRNAELQWEVVRRATPTLTFRIPHSALRTPVRSASVTAPSSFAIAGRRFRIRAPAI